VSLGFVAEKGEGKTKAVNGKGQNEEVMSSFRMSYRAVVFSSLPLPRLAKGQQCSKIF
jgi:hypothetical protein